MKQLYPFLILLFLFTLLSPSSLLAQQDSTVSFVAYWQKGETRKYKIIKKKTQHTNGKEQKNDLTTYITSFTVLDSTSDSYLLEWKYENKLFDSSPEVAAQFESLGDKYRYLTIKYKTDELGAFQGIENWKEVSKMMNDMFDIAVKNYKSADQKSYEQALLPMRQAMSSKEGLELMVFKELRYIHSPYGAMYSLMDTIRYEDQLPNLFGGDPIKAIASLYFTEADFENLTCGYIHEIVPTPEDSKRMVTEMYDKMLGNISDKALRERRKTEINTAFKNMKMEIKDISVYRFDMDTTWPIYLSTKRIVNVDLPNEKGTTTEETIIERVN